MVKRSLAFRRYISTTQCGRLVFVGQQRARQLRRARQRVKRRREAHEERVRQVQRAEREAAIRGDFEQRQRRHRVAYGLWVIAAVIAIAHWFVHLGVLRPITGSPGLDDLVIGWPIALVLAIVAAKIYGT